jgi:uncharacterized protein (DUF952 family)
VGEPPPTQPILHLMTRRAWSEAPADALRPPSLTDEGFVHCSAPHQVAGVANDRFAGEDELVMLVLDPGALDGEVVWEDSYGSGQDFPHVYGPIDRREIVRVVSYRTDADGSFSPPVLDELP